MEMSGIKHSGDQWLSPDVLISRTFSRPVYQIGPGDQIWRPRQGVFPLVWSGGAVFGYIYLRIHMTSDVM